MDKNETNMEPLTIATAASSVLNGIGNLIGARKQRQFAADEAAKQRDWNAQMMDKENQWSLEQWNRTNEYNTPAAQRQRLLDAGLNPMYYGLDGNGNANAFESAQALGYDRAGMEQIANPNALNALGEGVQGALAGLQMEKELKAKQAEIDNLNQNTAKQGEETATEIERRQNMIAERDKLVADTRAAMASAELSSTERAKLEKDIEWYDRLTEAEINAKDSQSKLNESQRNRIEQLLPGEKELQNMSIEDFYHQWEKISAECAKMAAETGLVNADIENYALNHMQSGVLNTGLSVYNAVRGRLEKVKNGATRKQIKNKENAQNERLKSATENM